MARAVAGRGLTGTGARARTSGTAAPAPAQPQGNPNMLGDLEAEMMGNLQASFTVVDGGADQAEAPAEDEPEPELPPPPHAKPADGVVRDRLTDALAALAPVLKFDRPLDAEDEPSAETQTRAAPDSGATVRAPLMAESTSTRFREALATLPQARPEASTKAAVRTAVGRGAAQPPARAATTAVSDSGRPLPTMAPAARVAPAPERIDLPNLHLRNPPSAPESRSRSPHPRWERPAETARVAAAAASRFAPPKVTAPATESDEDEDDLFAKGGPFADGLALDPPEGEPADEFDAPGDIVEDETDAGADYATYVRRRSRQRRLRVATVAVATLLVGGVAYGMLRGGNIVTLPPLITADAGPSKVAKPRPAEADQSKQSYDRITTASTPAGTTLVKPASGIAAVPPPDPTPSSPITQLIGSPVDSGAATATTVADGTAPVNEPRKVRTLVVKPDGTIISSDATDPSASPASSAPAPAVAATPAPVRQVGSAAPVAAASAATAPAPAPIVRPSNNETLNVAGAGAGNSPGGDLVITSNPSGPAPGATATKPATGTAVANATAVKPPAATATPSAPAATAPAATTSKSATTSGAGSAAATTAPRPTQPAATPAAPATTQVVGLASGAIMVQLSSQKTEEGARATYKDLQAHYPKILGSYDVNVQRADLGDRGVFYRARVGPFSSADAKRMCDDLKSAGGDCILTQ